MAMYIYIWLCMYIYIVYIYSLVQYSSYILQVREHMGTKKNDIPNPALSQLPRKKASSALSRCGNRVVWGWCHASCRSQLIFPECPNHRLCANTLGRVDDHRPILQHTCRGPWSRLTPPELNRRNWNPLRNEDLIAISSINGNGRCSIAMFVYRRVNIL